MSVKVSIGVISYNRKKYMQSLLKSLECVKDDDEIQVVVVDNGSTEPGLVEMLKESSVIDSLHLGKKGNWINDEYIAKNKITDLSQGDVLFSMQDDRQLLGTPEYIKMYARDLMSAKIPYMGVDAVRICTLGSRIDKTQCLLSQETGCKYWMNLNNHVGTTGMFIVDILKELGPYPVNWPVEKSYWGRSEDVFNNMMWKKYPQQCVSIRSHVPLVAGVWNDPRGGQAFIRNDMRHGVYKEAPDKSGLYYRMLDNNEIKKMLDSTSPMSFVDVCDPIGWEYAKDAHGDQKKFSQKDVIVEGPSEPVSYSSLPAEDENLNEDKEWVEEWLES
jgi:glycosyltransferase involved in cell wall biosynthesis